MENHIATYYGKSYRALKAFQLEIKHRNIETFCVHFINSIPFSQLISLHPFTLATSNQTILELSTSKKDLNFKF